MRSVLRDARRLVDRRTAKRFSLLSAASVVVAALDAAGIVLLVPLIDALSGAEEGQGVSIPIVDVVDDVPVGGLLAAVVVFFVAKSLGMALLRWWSVGLVLNAGAVGSTRLFAAYLDAPVEYHDARNSADSVRTIASSVRTFFTSGVLGAATAIAEATTLMLIGVLVLILSPVPALAGIAYFALASVVYLKLLQARTERSALAAEKANAASLQAVQEALGGLREHKVRGSESGLIEEFAVRQAELARAQRFTTFAGELSRYYLEVLLIGGFGITTAVVLAASSGGAELTTLAVLLAVAFRIMPSLSRTLAAANSVRIGRAALEIIVGELDGMGVDRLPAVSTNRAPGGAITGRMRPHLLELRGVTFAYPNAGEPALRDVTLRIEPGTSLGVVGPSGAGKSTLVDVVCGLRVPQSGDVLVDDRRLGDDVQAWRRSIGLVPQDVYLLDAPIRDNVAFGLEVDDARVWDALRRAQLATFVETLPEGLDTMVGERGTRVSGGQRQRLGIARALYNEPAVLVLDEATAALDVETEATVVEAINALRGQLSLLVVAHRLSTIRHCDAIAYLEGGNVRAVGTFDEVARRVPEFAHVVQLARITDSGAP